jgi:hypothetical protein
MKRRDEETASQERNKKVSTNRLTKRVVLAVGGALLMAALFAAAAFAGDDTSFKMVRSQAARDKDCLQGASANVDIHSTPVGNQIMDVELKHAAKNTEYTLFVIQQPNDPFGVSWYQGDIATDNQGNGSERFIGIFSEEVFAFSPASVKAPQVDEQDAKKGPKFKPVHTFHLGLWFADPKEAKDAGCSGKVTPFDGDHEAGIQALSTRNFPNQKGPLGEIQ